MVIQQIKIFLGHIRNEDETGKLLLSDLEYIQIVADIENSILHKNTQNTFIHWTSTAWISNFKVVLDHTNRYI